MIGVVILAVLAAREASAGKAEPSEPPPPLATFVAVEPGAPTPEIHPLLVSR